MSSVKCFQNAWRKLTRKVRSAALHVLISKFLDGSTRCEAHSSAHYAHVIASLLGPNALADRSVVVKNKAVHTQNFKHEPYPLSSNGKWHRDFLTLP